MRPLLPARLSNVTLRALGLASIGIFLLTAFRAGWTRPATDFPNYYTAALLLKRHEPLRSYYDWTWFQKQMNFAGYEHQLGAYAAQTPLTMLPMLAPAVYSPQTGKRIWTCCSLVFLVAAIWLLSRLTGLRWEYLALLAICGYTSLYTNFLLGQYYVFLLFLLTAVYYSLERRPTAIGGIFAGVSFALKLYGGPFFLYFAARREWRALAGMVCSFAALAILALTLFGWNDILYYVTEVLPRSLAGGSIDPYHPANATLSTMLRRSFLREPGLNPHPLLDAPWLFFFLRPLMALVIAASVTLGVALHRTNQRCNGYAWFMVAILLLSTSTASYTFILLLLPVALLLPGSAPWKRAVLVASFILLNAPLQPNRLFPKVWLLLLLFAIVGWEFWQSIHARWIVPTAVLVVLAASVDAFFQLRDFQEEPGRHFQQIATEPGALFSSYPVITNDGLFFQGLHGDRYVLCWLHGGRVERFPFNGQVFHPRAPSLGGPVWFELVHDRTSTMMRFEPRTKVAAPSPLRPDEETRHFARSPDGKWTADTLSGTGPKQIWLRNTVTGETRRLTGGRCNSDFPAWEPDSKAIVFASDCGRALGLPALYRALVKQE